MKTVLFKYNSNMRLEIGDMAINLNIDHLYTLWSNMMNKAKIDISDITTRNSSIDVSSTPWGDCIEIDKVVIEKSDDSSDEEDMGE